MPRVQIRNLLTSNPKTRQMKPFEQGDYPFSRAPASQSARSRRADVRRNRFHRRSVGYRARALTAGYTAIFRGIRIRHLPFARIRASSLSPSLSREREETVARPREKGRGRSKAKGCRCEHGGIRASLGTRVTPLESSPLPPPCSFSLQRCRAKYSGKMNDE